MKMLMYFVRDCFDYVGLFQ